MDRPVLAPLPLTPAPDASNAERFACAYRDILADAVARNPDDYAMAPGQTPAQYAGCVAPKMVSILFAEGAGMVAASPSLRRAARRCGVDGNLRAVVAYLRA